MNEKSSTLALNGNDISGIGDRVEMLMIELRKIYQRCVIIDFINVDLLFQEYDHYEHEWNNIVLLLMLHKYKLHIY